MAQELLYHIYQNTSTIKNNYLRYRNIKKRQA